MSRAENAALANAIAQSDVLTRAQAAIDSGHPWRATQIITPELREPAQRSPAALMVAARAAAGWAGWPEVDRLIGGAPWIDTAFGGAGRELLARSALERNADTAALVHATAAARDAGDRASRSTRFVLLARALERNGQFDSAAATYARAAEALPRIEDWLELRAAGSERDSVARAKRLERVALATAKPRVAWTEAQARERFGDLLGAATQYTAIGEPVQALRLRLTAAADDASRGAITAQLVSFIRAHSGSADARGAIDVLDKASSKLGASDELIVARSAAVSGPAARAAQGYAATLRESQLVTDNDRMLYAEVLSRLGRSRDALSQLSQVRGVLTAQAGYQRARILLAQGSATAARTALRDVVSRYPKEAGVASMALYLLADLATDAGDDRQARATFQRLYRTYPTSPRASAARFHAAMIAIASGNPRTAARELDSLYARAPRSDYATAARYWSGRAWSSAKNPTLARQRWRAIITDDPLSYYAFTSARRLGERSWTPSGPEAAGQLTRVPSIDSAVARIELLDRLGMDAEERFELDALEAAARGSTDRVLATADAFVSVGQPSRAIRLAQRLADQGVRDPRLYRFLFPLVDREELARNAKARGLDPALIAGLIRQESNFTPRAVSVAGARGLMQVLPSVGQDIARSLGFPVWSPALLLDADANLQLGTAHLAAMVKEYGALPRVLAAYNAGGSRVDRWSKKAGAADPELFIERIPYAETRDYVRIVQRNMRVYAALYGL
ncbi:MAG TPA: transglycosylase SLT domain-containing protein [Gemmatimonadaceae bacterium]|nr:transglycosylase SLT domain-containing protein [Gemmatimonadaceae bacterium]